MSGSVTVLTSEEVNRDIKEEIFRLWNSEYPANLSYPTEADFDEQLLQWRNKRHYLALDANEHFLGWLMTFDRDEERWFSIIVKPGNQLKGVGRFLLSALKKQESPVNGWILDSDQFHKANGQPYPSPRKFYEKNGLQVLDDVRFEKKGLLFTKIRWEK